MALTFPFLSTQGTSLPKTPRSWSPPARRRIPLQRSPVRLSSTCPGLLGKAPHPSSWLPASPTLGWWCYLQGGARPGAGQRVLRPASPDTPHPVWAQGCSTQTPPPPTHTPLSPHPTVGQGESQGTENRGSADFLSAWRALSPLQDLARCRLVSRKPSLAPRLGQASALRVHKAPHSACGLGTTICQCPPPRLWAPRGQGWPIRSRITTSSPGLPHSTLNSLNHPSRGPAPICSPPLSRPL